MHSGDRIEIEASALDEEDGVALLDGFEVRVPNLWPGERALVRIEHVGKARKDGPRRAYGRVLEVLKRSPARVLPACRKHEMRDGHCTGCPWMVASLDAQRAEKAARLAREYGFEVGEVVASPDALGYRWSSKRVARRASGPVHLGSFRRGSHQLADMADCLVDHPDIAACAREVAEQASRVGMETYDERTRRGDLRYVWLKTDGRGAVLVTLITAREESRAPELAAALTTAAGVAWSVQSGEGNAVRGASATVLSGVASIAVELCGQRVEVGPLGFLQPNPRAAELCYRDLCGDVRAERCFDLYAGVGVTTAVLAASCGRVTACESNAESAAQLGAPAQTVEAFLASAIAVDDVPGAVIANPPRAGMGAAVCAHLAALAARGLEALRIMSCGPAALRRDIDALAGAFHLERVRAYDTLPHTPHVELVAHLRRR
jgi:23S rRNA (uracil1939-C5)-methyltransferase